MKTTPLALMVGFFVSSCTEGERLNLKPGDCVRSVMYSGLSDKHSQTIRILEVGKYRKVIERLTGGGQLISVDVASIEFSASYYYKVECPN